MLTVNCKGRLLSLSSPVVMGIINVTPDSFYSDSRRQNEGDILSSAEKMLQEGATFLDVGGQSTRPGSDMVTEKEEADRVLPAIRSIAAQFPDALISIDTFYAGVAQKAVDGGACLVNDVSAGTIDNKLIATVAALRVPYVLMHMKGLPVNMQISPGYNDVVLDVFDFLNFKMRELRNAGITDIIVDPGFGFGKTADHNFRLLDELNRFTKLDAPIMAGISRKGTIYKTLGVQAEEALNGTTVLNTIALMNGASILRVHDVKEAVEAIKLTNAIKKQRAAGGLPL
jgi:dihydropteroate synthase